MKDIDSVLRDLKKRLSAIYGERLEKMIIYGSWARNEAKEGSDIDIAIVLKGKVVPGKEIDRIIDTINELNLEHGVLISVYPVSVEWFEKINSPLLLNIRKEGIPI